jgi:hypothetical protein
MNLEPSQTTIQINISLFGMTPTTQEVVVSTSTRTRRRAIYGGRTAAASRTDVDKITSLEILLNSLEPGYDVLKPIPVTIGEVDGSFVARFTAANVGASGDTWDEAATNLKYLLTDTLDMLLTHRPEALGPKPRHQLTVLRAFISKTEDDQ